MEYTVNIRDSNGFSIKDDCLFCSYETNYKLPIKDITGVTSEGNSVYINMKNGDVIIFKAGMTGTQILILILLLFFFIVCGIIYAVYVDSQNKDIAIRAHRNVLNLLDSYNSTHKTTQVSDDTFVVAHGFDEDSENMENNDTDHKINSSGNKEDNKVESLKKWKDLLDQGVITEEEFLKEKEKILNDDN